MKSLICCIAICCVVVSPLSINQSYAVGFNDAESVCLFVAENNKQRLRKMLKEMHLKIKTLYDSVTCNGLNLVQFAMKRNADDVGEFLVKQIPASKLKDNGDLEWANTNGFGDSLTAKAIQERISS